MKRSVFFSLILHLAALAGLVWGAERGNRNLGPPVKVYGVEILGAPGRRDGSGVTGTKGSLPKPSLPTPRTDVVRSRSRTGLKVETAPSTDPFAPKGTKKPARTPKQKPEAEGNPGNPGGKGVPGGGGGALKIEGDVPFPYPGYIDSLQTQVQAHWEEPLIVNTQGALKTTVFFRILRDGTITDFRVESPSKVLQFDRSALDAVVRSSPVFPLPGGFKSDYLGVYFDFEY
jgi:TonB family protein